MYFQNYPKNGNDFCDGGRGYDTVVLEGKKSDYTITKQDNGDLKITKDKEEKILTAVELIKFSDGITELIKTPTVSKIKTIENDEGKGFDYNSVMNNYGGFYNAPCYSNIAAFAALKEDGSIKSWGNSNCGGSGAPDPRLPWRRRLPWPVWCRCCWSFG